MVNFYTYLTPYLDDMNKVVSLSEFEKHFKRPHQTIKKHLQELVEKKILIIEKRARFTFYKLNKKNPLLKEYISICEKKRMFDFLEKNVLIKRMYELIAPCLSKNKVLIFGSATEKEEFADIDLLILSNDKEIREKIDEFVKTYSVKIHIVQTDEKSLAEAFIEEIRKKHIILNEFDYFIRKMYKNEFGLV